jgi:hypothetical protein
MYGRAVIPMMIIQYLRVAWNKLRLALLIHGRSVAGRLERQINRAMQKINVTLGSEEERTYEKRDEK